MGADLGAWLTLLVLLVGVYFAGRGDGERAARRDYQPAIDALIAELDARDRR